MVNAIAPVPAADWNVTLWNSATAKFAKAIVCELVELKTTDPVPPDQLADVLPLDHAPLNVQTPLPIRTYADALAIETLPETATVEAPLEPSRTAVPLKVRLPETVRPLPVDAPIVIEPLAWMRFPPTLKSNVPIARVPVQPVVSKDPIATLASTDAVPPPEFPSKKVELPPVGAAHPPGPPEELAQCVVWDQLPIPPTQYRFPPHGERTRTSTTGSEPSIVKMTFPEASTEPVVNSEPSFVTLNRFPTPFPAIVNVRVELPTVEESVHL